MKTESEKSLNLFLLKMNRETTCICTNDSNNHNPIEIVWRELKGMEQQRRVDLELKLKTLSMPKRIDEVLKKNGDAAKFY